MATEVGPGRGGGNHRAVVRRQSHPWPILQAWRLLVFQTSPCKRCSPEPCSFLPAWMLELLTRACEKSSLDLCCGDVQVLHVQSRDRHCCLLAPFKMCVYTNLSVNNSLEIKQKRPEERRRRTNSVKFTLVPLPGTETKPQATTSALGASW